MNSNIVHLEPDPHVAVQMLLPWYLTGRLAPEERTAVESHLSTCAQCRAELDTERQWREMQPVQMAHVDVEEGWARMRARLATDGDAEAPEAEAGTGARGRAAQPPASAPQAPHPAHPHGTRGWRGWRSGGHRGTGTAWPAAGLAPASLRPWALPAALSMALIAAIAWTLRPVAPPVGEYHALSAPPVATATAVVRFRPEATEAQIRLSLTTSGARLVDGPTVTDAYVVRLPRDRYEAALAILRRQNAVALVEALQSAPPP
jgi:anti-sigma factor RsiW